MNPFDLPAGPFLVLYVAMLAATIIAGMIIPRWLRPDGRRLADPDAEQLAILTGGRDRFADSVATRLLTRGALATIGRSSLAARPGARGESAAETALLGLPGEFKWSAALGTLKPYAEPVEHRLVASGLWIDAADRASVRFWQTLPFMLLLGFGAVRYLLGEARDKPVGYLSILLIATAIFAAIRWFSVDRRTRAGMEVVKTARQRHDRLRIAPTGAEASLGVALFGTAVLAGSEWGDFHTMRQTSGGDGGGSSDSGGDSDGGGGGCGGCGGGD